MMGAVLVRIRGATSVHAFAIAQERACCCREFAISERRGLGSRLGARRREGRGSVRPSERGGRGFPKTKCCEAANTEGGGRLIGNHDLRPLTPAPLHSRSEAKALTRSRVRTIAG